jgi:hypothetical protein
MHPVPYLIPNAPANFELYPSLLGLRQFLFFSIFLMLTFVVDEIVCSYII